jgi:hypothetical protein
MEVNRIVCHYTTSHTPHAGTDESHPDSGIGATTSEPGYPELGELARCAVNIADAKEVNKVVDKLFEAHSSGHGTTSNSWKQQFRDAVHMTPNEAEEGKCVGSWSIILACRQGTGQEEMV